MIKSSISPEDIDRIIHYAAGLPDNAALVDIGTHNGASAVILAEFSPDSAHVWTIDCGEAQLYSFGSLHCAEPKHRKTMVRRLTRIRREYETRLASHFSESGYQHKITFLFGSSHPHEYLSTIAWPPERLVDLLLVDGDHYYPSVMADMLRWMPKVKSGGYAMFHDYNGWDVEIATRHYLEAHPIWSILETTKMMLYCQKGM